MDWPGGSWQDTIQFVAIILGSYIAILWFAAIVWTYRDIRDRTRDVCVSQAVALLLVLVFNVPGLLLYLIMRPAETMEEAYERSLESEALLLDLQRQPPCPNCRQRVQQDFIVCPYCATDLRVPCSQCDRAIRVDWTVCPYCGAARRQATKTATTVPRVEEPIVASPPTSTSSAPTPAVPDGPADMDEPPSGPAQPASPTKRKRRSAAAPGKPEPLL